MGEAMVIIGEATVVDAEDAEDAKDTVVIKKSR
jgi:hypothetical protein